MKLLKKAFQKNKSVATQVNTSPESVYAALQLRYFKWNDRFNEEKFNELLESYGARKLGSTSHKSFFITEYNIHLVVDSQKNLKFILALM